MLEEIKERNKEAQEDKFFLLNKVIFELTERVKKIENFREETIKDIQRGVANLLSSGDFYESFRKHLVKVIEAEVRTQIINRDIFDDLRAVTSTQTETLIKSNFDEIIKRVIIETINHQLKKMKYEMEQVKNLAYSVDSGIKHILQKSPVSLDSEKIIVKRIYAEIEKMSVNNLLRIEQK